MVEYEYEGVRINEDSIFVLFFLYDYGKMSISKLLKLLKKHKIHVDNVYNFIFDLERIEFLKTEINEKNELILELTELGRLFVFHVKLFEGYTE